MIYILIFIGLILIAFYKQYIHWVTDQWDSLEDNDIPLDYTPKTKISIIIPIRNEQDYIENCINSLLDNHYPNLLYEIIIVNDHSDDNSVSIINNINDKRVKLLHLADYLKSINISAKINAYKKAALQYAINESQGDLIITTDGDSVVKPDFLRAYAYYYETNNVKMMAAPVKFEKANNFIESFQVLDMVSMMGITAAGISANKYYLANGANLAFDKQTFIGLEPYDITKTASGDDMFLVQSIASKYPGEVHFVKAKSAIVTTALTHSFNDFWQQRKRWASKSNQYQESNIKWLMVLVFLVNIFPFIMLGLSIILWSKLLLFVAVLIILAKYNLDYRYLKKILVFFDYSDAIIHFPKAFFFYIIYMLYTGFVGLFPSKYTWKERKVS